MPGSWGNNPKLGKRLKDRFKALFLSELSDFSQWLSHRQGTAKSTEVTLALFQPKKSTAYSEDAESDGKKEEFHSFSSTFWLPFLIKIWIPLLKIRVLKDTCRIPSNSFNMKA